MSSILFRYLRRNKLSEIRTVNRLFVSSYVLLSKLEVHHSSFLKQYLIQEGDNDFDVLNDFIYEVKRTSQDILSIEDLIELFEFVISPSDRIITGAIYTPQYVRKNIIEECLGKFNLCNLNIKIADIACGCGGFLMDAALKIHNVSKRSFSSIYKKNIFGIDIQEYSVERTKILLSLLALTYNEDRDFEFNIKHADTLDFCHEGWDPRYCNFDVIVGNPPYVCSRNVSEETKAKMLQYEVSKSGHPDLYIPFFQIAVDMLKTNGCLGYITMNSFIRSINGRALRIYLSKGLHRVCIKDFRGYQVFKRKSTYTCLFFLEKFKQSNSICYIAIENGELNNNQYDTIPFSSLDNKKGWSLNQHEKASSLEIGTPIGLFCDSRHGLATLSNKTYIFSPIKEDKRYYYLENNDIIYPIERGICRDVINSNKFNSDVNFRDVLEKIIFPYNISNNKHAKVIEETELSNKFPCAYQYLCSQKNVLSLRDKGNTKKYPTWYAFGRTQSLVMPRYKLFFPKFANKSVRCILKDDENLLLYNGIAFVSNEINKLITLKEILESDAFWQYVTLNAKPYASGYYSLSGVDIKNFGINY